MTDLLPSFIPTLLWIIVVLFAILTVCAIRKYNKFSLIEAYAFTKLYVLKAIYVPALLRVDSNDTESTLESPLSVENCSYYIEAGAFKAIVEQSSSKSGRYCLTVRCYPDTEAAKTVIVVSDDPALAQTVVASVRPA